ncbi:MAG: hypothetical protein KF734_14570 [Saprospiraceae bacterium]|nr:hypothetical protein [Saprospiraceae bacterium]
MRQLIFISLIIFVFSCSKEESNDYYWGTASAKFNGDSWLAQPRASVNKPYMQGIDIVIERQGKGGYVKEILFLYKLPSTTGKYPLSDTEVRDIDSLIGAKFFTMDDVDVLGDVYRLHKGGTDNYLEITKIEGDQIWAEFQLAFVRQIVGTVSSYPDTIILSNGKIHTKIVKPE